jgi:hypothetical protein
MSFVLCIISASTFFGKVVDLLVNDLNVNEATFSHVSVVLSHV